MSRHHLFKSASVTTFLCLAFTLFSQLSFASPDDQAYSPEDEQKMISRKELAVDKLQLATDIIENTPFITVATVTDNCEPVAAVLFTAVDEQLNFYWISSENAQHSINIENNQMAYLTLSGSAVTGSENKGVYIKAETKVLTDPADIAKAGQMLKTLAASQEKFNYPFSDIDDTEESGLRYYRASAHKIWISDEVRNEQGEVVGYTNAQLCSQWLSQNLNK